MPSRCHCQTHPGRSRSAWCQNRECAGAVVDLIGFSSLDTPKVPLIAEEFVHQTVVQRVRPLLEDQVTDHLLSAQRQVTDRAQNLMPYELISIAQPLGVEDVEVIDDDRVLEATTLGKPLASQIVHLTLEGEGPRLANLLDKAGRAKVKGVGLPSDQRMVKVDAGGDSEATAGF